MTDDIDDRQLPPRTTAAAGVDLARLAHELRTPLSAIAVLAEIMRDERLGPIGSSRYRGYAADIHASATHANNVLSSLIEPVRGTSQSGALSFVELDLGADLAGAVSALAPLAERSAVTLRMALPAALPHLIADRRCLRQILDNLVANALKFTPPGGQIVVAVEHVVGGPVAVTVSDTGDGMTPEELERVRSTAARPEPLRRRSGGSGIGLPMVRTLAAACGASLEIDSTLGRGTVVTVTFPHDRVVPV